MNKNIQILIIKTCSLYNPLILLLIKTEYPNEIIKKNK